MWLDEDESAPRVVVATGEKLFVLWFQNRTQAKRCASALLDEKEPRTFVAGHRPRPIDLLASLRFIGIALPFLVEKSPLALLVLLIAAPSLLAFLRAQQVRAGDEGVSIRSWRGTTTIRWEEIERIDEDVLLLRDGRSITIARGSIRDVLLTTPAWTGDVHQRIVKRITEKVREATAK